MTENVKTYEVLDCPNQMDRICILSRLKRIKISSGVINSLKVRDKQWTVELFECS